MESINKLRELRDEAARKMVDNPRWVCAKCEEIADEIEREIAERYTELPVDADGVPIRVGELLKEPDGTDYGVVQVTELTYDGEDWYFKGEIPLSFTGQAGYFNTLAWHHVKPDPVKELLEEFANNGTPTGDGGVIYEVGLIEQYAAKIRKAVES